MLYPCSTVCVPFRTIPHIIHSAYVHKLNCCCWCLLTAATMYENCLHWIERKRVRVSGNWERCQTPNGGKEFRDILMVWALLAVKVYYENFSPIHNCKRLEKCFWESQQHYNGWRKYLMRSEWANRFASAVKFEKYQAMPYVSVFYAIVVCISACDIYVFTRIWWIQWEN